MLSLGFAGEGVGFKNLVEGQDASARPCIALYVEAGNASADSRGEPPRTLFPIHEEVEMQAFVGYNLWLLHRMRLIFIFAIISARDDA